MKKVLVFLFMSIGNTSKLLDAQDYVYLGGETVGIVMGGEVVVNRLFDVNGVRPWNHTNIQEGSIIESVNDYKIETINELRSHVVNSKGDSLKVNYKTNDEVFTTSIKPQVVNNTYSIGVDARDKLEGVGTLTYVDEQQNYGALGHIVKTSFSSGTLKSSSVNQIRKSEPGNPGFKYASLGTQQFGSIHTNNFTGIYGKVETLDVLTRKEKIAVGRQNEVKTGTAHIYTVLENNTVTKHSIKITNVQKQANSDVKGLSIEVTDKALLEKTGGIVQGMSGSPIVQNKKIVGAVTHVIVDNPKTGYGIYIDWMLKNNS